MATTESVLEQPAAHLHSSVKTLDQTSLHLLPCGIQHDGKANIPGFFFLVDGEYPSKTASLTSEVTSATSTSLLTGNAAVTTTTTTTSTSTSTSTAPILESRSVPPEVSFRGRTLKGSVMTVPAGYIGTIYKPAEQGGEGQGSNSNNGLKPSQDMDLDDDQEYEAMLKGMQEERKAMKTEAQFTEWMSWGHDDQPTSRTDKVVRAMQWIDIAHVLHEPLC
ncbi:Ribonuclease H2 subunit C [Linnemannia gamsii]|uniref:Ribonuclease H2 subunit C n=1 Tax=Linnemannia gamsii TaxID=64522 RepID=A0ABQ7JM75_9FUNG|nr:Ribonuclease H2 subunit C [Linnemannia gamsii]